METPHFIHNRIKSKATQKNPALLLKVSSMASSSTRLVLTAPLSHHCRRVSSNPGLLCSISTVSETSHSKLPYFSTISKYFSPIVCRLIGILQKSRSFKIWGERALSLQLPPRCSSWILRSHSQFEDPNPSFLLFARSLVLMFNSLSLLFLEGRRAVRAGGDERTGSQRQGFQREELD